MPGRNALLALLTGQAVVFTLIGMGLWWLSQGSVARFVTFGSDEFATGAALAAVLVLVAAATFYGLPRLSEYLIRAQAETLAFLEKPLPFWAVVWVSLCAGIGEEALFRGGVQTLAADYMPMPLAIALAAGLFAAVHLAKPAVSLVIFAIGVLFGWLYWQTGSLLSVMIGHAIYDVFALWYVQKELHRLGVFARAEPDDTESITE